MNHDCPAKVCTKSVSQSMLMCRAHWYMVPKPLRNAVYDAWANGHGAGTPAHRAAILAAIEAVDKQLADTPP